MFGLSQSFPFGAALDSLIIVASLSRPSPKLHTLLRPLPPVTVTATATATSTPRPSPLFAFHPTSPRYITSCFKMGLPVWRSPSPAAKDALKVDLTAPARSPIRRRAQVGRRARSSPSPRSPGLRDSSFASAEQFFAATETADRRSSSARPRLPPPPVPESRNYARHTESARDLDDGLARLRRDRYYRTLYDSSIPSFGEVSRSTRQLPAFTPNFAPAAAARNHTTSVETIFRDVQDRPTYRNRSPYSRPVPRPRSSWIDAASLSSHDNLVIVEDGDDDSSDNNAVGFPPLRRMGRRTIADGPLPSSSLRESWSPVTSVDGLGDRERSISPVDDHWDTMLNSVAPDPLPPTADSSFASAAASASFSNSHPSSRAGSSNSNSAASSRTHLTVPSRHQSPPSELFIRACDTSEDDTASDTEEDEDEDEETDIHPVLSSLLRRSRQRYTDEPPSRNSNRYSRGVHNRSRDASAYVRSFYGGIAPRDVEQPRRSLNDQLDGPAEESSLGYDDVSTLDEQSFEGRDSARDQDLRDARAFLERLSQRDDVSDEFWASVGLTRPLADRVERIQQRERL
ncbi:hypothetical protein K504DRAFT_492637 [Pleomassaria siparia CBS 279.74]|uniref:Uncharacterized protein n=1 Tax=Pleomassaria siparia CBS 279.74 TaxID=1314801 RepID=A0A6G1K2J3_9PLEO|nr:hypothetical protein K504DRAFT_492637 [Pleomassaria siparia CBS 279.74]